jgi:hypothetical protein
MCLGAPRPTGLYGQPFEHRPAPIVDAGRARLRAIGERLKQICQLGVAMLFHEPRHVVGPVTAARLANDRQRGVTKVGKDDRAVARHRSRLHTPHRLRNVTGLPQPEGIGRYLARQACHTAGRGRLAVPEHQT